METEMVLKSQIVNAQRRDVGLHFLYNETAKLEIINTGNTEM